MYDCTNIGFLAVALIFPGGDGGIAYALHVEHPYPQYFQLRIRPKACWRTPWRLGDGCGCSSRFLFFYLLENWRLDLSFGSLSWRRVWVVVGWYVVSVGAVRRLLAELLNVAEDISLVC